MNRFKFKVKLQRIVSAFLSYINLLWCKSWNVKKIHGRNVSRDVRKSQINLNIQNFLWFCYFLIFWLSTLLNFDFLEFLLPKILTLINSDILEALRSDFPKFRHSDVLHTFKRTNGREDSSIDFNYKLCVYLNLCSFIYADCVDRYLNLNGSFKVMSHIRN